jgi:hypothetical protein
MRSRYSLCLFFVLLPSCGTGSGDSAAPSASALANCQAICLRFGPEPCTRQCYALCETCAATLDVKPDSVVGMECKGSTVSINTGLNSRSCPAGRDVSYSGQLPAGGWQTAKRAFVTSQSYAGGAIKSTGGQATGLASADALCAGLAAAAGVTGSFRAWLSDSTTSAIDRIQGTGPWLNMNRSYELFRNESTHVASLSRHKLLDERGQTPSVRTPWTGTGETGKHKPPMMGDMGATNCADWSASTYKVGTTNFDYYGIGGFGHWSDGPARMCSESYPLYCFEQ